MKELIICLVVMVIVVKVIYLIVMRFRYKPGTGIIITCETRDFGYIFFKNPRLLLKNKGINFCYARFIRFCGDDEYKFGVMLEYWTKK